MITRSTSLRQDSILAIFEGQSATERLVLVWRSAPEHGSRLELRQQSWGEGIGWFTQQSISLTPDQARDLRYALRGSAAPSEARPELGESNGKALAPAERPLRLVRAEPA